MDTDKVVLSGMDGSNPLGFLAALGLLRVLDDNNVDPTSAPRLSWADHGRWLPVLHWHGDKDALLGAIEQDIVLSRNASALDLVYDAQGEPMKDGDEATRDLKPKPETFRLFQNHVAHDVALAPGQAQFRRYADLVAAYGSEFATDNKGRVKPTAFHFTAGQQAFISMVRELANGIERKHLEEALWGPWLAESKLPSLSWNAAASRVYAFRAGNPAKEKRGSVPGADWLGFVALSCLPSVSVGRRLRTACVRGGWKDSSFTWPIWKVPISISVVRSLLARADIAQLASRERASIGIEAVMQSGILRSDQGGYGSFTPATTL